MSFRFFYLIIIEEDKKSKHEKSKRAHNIYNIGVLTVNIEFMWRGLETRERQFLGSLFIRFVPSHIYYIFTVNTAILYLSCNKIC